MPRRGRQRWILLQEQGVLGNGLLGVGDPLGMSTQYGFGSVNLLGDFHLDRDLFLGDGRIHFRTTHFADLKELQEQGGGCGQTNTRDEHQADYDGMIHGGR